MTWLAIALLTAAAFLLAAFVLKAPRKGREPIAAALLLGLAGFVQQARTDLPGAPTAANEARDIDGAKLVELRRAFMAEGAMPLQNRWLVTSDALTRGGEFGDAAGLAKLAVENDPHNAEAWLALGNDLAAHAQGTLTPASLYAYRKASEAAPDSAGPPFFLGMALAQSGRYDEARKVLGDLLAHSPEKAPWREFLSGVVSRLDALIAAENKSSPGQ